MDRRAFAALIAALVLIGPLASAAPAGADRSPALRLVVELAPGFDAAALPGDPVVEVVDRSFVAVEATPSEEAVLRGSPAVAGIEPDGVAHAAVVPSDPCWTSCSTTVSSANDQWGFQRIGADSAWDVTTGSSSITVAVVDSGVRFTHGDLAGRVTPVIVDAALGLTDDFGHGTAVAGLIAATGNNSLAIAGLSWNVKVRSYKVLDASGSGSLATIAAAVNQAVTDGARIVNLSLTSSTDSAALHAAVQNAQAHGVLVVAAAGNLASTIDDTYPGRYDEVLGVAALGRDGQRAPFSNFGPWVDLAAPGVDVVSLSNTSDTEASAAAGTGKGTSFAAPLVSGTAALMLAQNPQLSLAQVRARLAATAVPIPGAQLGAGLIDTGSAVRVPNSSSPACSAAPPGWMLDGFGGLHAGGGAPAPTGGPYWKGWDIARDVAAGPTGGYVLDGWGGVHAFSGAPAITGSGYWGGWDIARAIVARPDGKGVYVLDGWGGVHLGRTPGSDAPTATNETAYWRGWDIARDIVLDPTNPNRGWVLEAFGGLHPFGGAAQPNVVGYHGGVDKARGVSVASNGRSGYVIDADGGLLPWALPGEPMPPRRYTASTEMPALRAIVFSGGDLSVGYAINGYGAIVPLQGAPCVPAPAWPGWDIARSYGTLK